MLIVCNGMFRSGSTLQHSLVKEIMGSDFVRDMGFFDAHGVMEKRTELQHMALDGQCYLIKTHASLPPITGNVRFIYSHRDLRDVAVSLYSKLECTDEVMIAMIGDSLDVYKSLKNLPPGSILIQSYRELTYEFERSIKDLADYLGVSLTQSQLESIKEKLNIDSVAAQLDRTTGLRNFLVYINRRLRLASSLRAVGVPAGVIARLSRLIKREGNGAQFHYNHISKHRGRVGVWKEVLDSDDVEMIERRYGWWLTELGYGLSNQ